MTEAITIEIDGKPVTVMIDRPYRLSCRVAGQVVVADALDFETAKLRLEQRYADARDKIDSTTAQAVYPRGCRYSGD
jgi:hypothetical protein